MRMVEVGSRKEGIDEFGIQINSGQVDQLPGENRFYLERG